MTQARKAHVATGTLPRGLLVSEGVGVPGEGNGPSLPKLREKKKAPLEEAMA